MISHQVLDNMEEEVEGVYRSSHIESAIDGLKEAIRILIKELRKTAECDHKEYELRPKTICNHCKKPTK